MAEPDKMFGTCHFFFSTFQKDLQSLETNRERLDHHAEALKSFSKLYNYNYLMDGEDVKSMSVKQSWSHLLKSTTELILNVKEPPSDDQFKELYGTLKTINETIKEPVFIEFMKLVEKGPWSQPYLKMLINKAEIKPQQLSEMLEEDVHILSYLAALEEASYFDQAAKFATAILLHPTMKSLYQKDCQITLMCCLEEEKLFQHIKYMDLTVTKKIISGYIEKEDLTGVSLCNASFYYTLEIEDLSFTEEIAVMWFKMTVLNTSKEKLFNIIVKELLPTKVNTVPLCSILAKALWKTIPTCSRMTCVEILHHALHLLLPENKQMKQGILSSIIYILPNSHIARSCAFTNFIENPTVEHYFLLSNMFKVAYSKQDDIAKDCNAQLRVQLLAYLKQNWPPELPASVDWVWGPLRDFCLSLLPNDDVAYINETESNETRTGDGPDSDMNITITSLFSDSTEHNSSLTLESESSDNEETSHHKEISEPENCSIEVSNDFDVTEKPVKINMDADEVTDINESIQSYESKELDKFDEHKTVKTIETDEIAQVSKTSETEQSTFTTENASTSKSLTAEDNELNNLVDVANDDNKLTVDPNCESTNLEKVIPSSQKLENTSSDKMVTTMQEILPLPVDDSLISNTEQSRNSTQSKKAVNKNNVTKLSKPKSTKQKLTKLSTDTTEKPWRCPVEVCSRDFRAKRGMSHHLASVHRWLQMEIKGFYESLLFSNALLEKSETDKQLEEKTTICNEKDPEKSQDIENDEKLVEGTADTPSELPSDKSKVCQETLFSTDQDIRTKDQVESEEGLCEGVATQQISDKISSTSTESFEQHKVLILPEQITSILNSNEQTTENNVEEKKQTWPNSLLEEAKKDTTASGADNHTLISLSKNDEHNNQPSIKTKNADKPITLSIECPVASCTRTFRHRHTVRAHIEFKHKIEFKLASEMAQNAKFIDLPLSNTLNPNLVKSDVDISRSRGWYWLVDGFLFQDMDRNDNPDLHIFNRRQEANKRNSIARDVVCLLGSAPLSFKLNSTMDYIQEKWQSLADPTPAELFNTEIEPNTQVPSNRTPVPLDDNERYENTNRNPNSPMEAEMFEFNHDISEIEVVPSEPPLVTKKLVNVKSFLHMNVKVKPKKSATKKEEVNNNKTSQTHFLDKEHYHNTKFNKVRKTSSSHSDGLTRCISHFFGTGKPSRTIATQCCDQSKTRMDELMQAADLKYKKGKALSTNTIPKPIKKRSSLSSDRSSHATDDHLIGPSTLFEDDLVTKKPAPKVTRKYDIQTVYQMAEKYNNMQSDLEVTGDSSRTSFEDALNSSTASHFLQKERSRARIKRKLSSTGSNKFHKKIENATTSQEIKQVTLDSHLTPIKKSKMQKIVMSSANALTKRNKVGTSKTSDSIKSLELKQTEAKSSQLPHRPGYEQLLLQACEQINPTKSEKPLSTTVENQSFSKPKSMTSPASPLSSKPLSAKRAFISSPNKDTKTHTKVTSATSGKRKISLRNLSSQKSEAVPEENDDECLTENNSFEQDSLCTVDTNNSLLDSSGSSSTLTVSDQGVSCPECRKVLSCAFSLNCHMRKRHKGHKKMFFPNNEGSSTTPKPSRSKNKASKNGQESPETSGESERACCRLTLKTLNASDTELDDLSSLFDHSSDGYDSFEGFSPQSTPTDDEEFLFLSNLETKKDNDVTTVNDNESGFSGEEFVTEKTNNENYTQLSNYSKPILNQTTDNLLTKASLNETQVNSAKNNHAKMEVNCNNINGSNELNLQKNNLSKETTIPMLKEIVSSYVTLLNIQDTKIKHSKVTNEAVNSLPDPEPILKSGFELPLLTEEQLAILPIPYSEIFSCNKRFADFSFMQLKNGYFKCPAKNCKRNFTARKPLSRHLKYYCTKNHEHQLWTSILFPRYIQQEKNNLKESEFVSSKDNLKCNDNTIETNLKSTTNVPILGSLKYCSSTRSHSSLNQQSTSVNLNQNTDSTDSKADFSKTLPETNKNMHEVPLRQETEAKTPRRTAYKEANIQIQLSVSPSKRKLREMQELTCLYNKRARKRIALALSPAKKLPNSNVKHKILSQDATDEEIKEELECWLCKAPFINQSNLTVHIQHHLQQIDRFRHRCNFKGCLYAFHSKKELKVHKHLHSTSYPHICLFCPFSYQRFKSFRKLLLHEYTEHQKLKVNLTKLRKCFCLTPFKSFCDIEEYLEKQTVSELSGQSFLAKGRRSLNEEICKQCRLKPITSVAMPRFCEHLISQNVSSVLDDMLWSVCQYSKSHPRPRIGVFSEVHVAKKQNTVHLPSVVSTDYSTKSHLLPRRNSSELKSAPLLLKDKRGTEKSDPDSHEKSLPKSLENKIPSLEFDKNSLAACKHTSQNEDEPIEIQVKNQNTYSPVIRGYQRSLRSTSTISKLFYCDGENYFSEFQRDDMLLQLVSTSLPKPSRKKRKNTEICTETARERINNKLDEISESDDFKNNVAPSSEDNKSIPDTSSCAAENLQYQNLNLSTDTNVHFENNCLNPKEQENLFAKESLHALDNTAVPQNENNIAYKNDVDQAQNEENNFSESFQDFKSTDHYVEKQFHETNSDQDMYNQSSFEENYENSNQSNQENFYGYHEQELWPKHVPSYNPSYEDKVNMEHQSTYWSNNENERFTSDIKDVLHHIICDIEIESQVNYLQQLNIKPTGVIYYNKRDLHKNPGIGVSVYGYRNLAFCARELFRIQTTQNQNNINPNLCEIEFNTEKGDNYCQDNDLQYNNQNFNLNSEYNEQEQVYLPYTYQHYESEDNGCAIITELDDDLNPISMNTEQNDKVTESETSNDPTNSGDVKTFLPLENNFDNMEYLKGKCSTPINDFVKISPTSNLQQSKSLKENDYARDSEIPKERLVSKPIIEFVELSFDNPNTDDVTNQNSKFLNEYEVEKQNLDLLFLADHSVTRNLNGHDNNFSLNEKEPTIWPQFVNTFENSCEEGSFVHPHLTPNKSFSDPDNLIVNIESNTTKNRDNDLKGQCLDLVPFSDNTDANTNNFKHSTTPSAYFNPDISLSMFEFQNHPHYSLHADENFSIFFENLSECTPAQRNLYCQYSVVGNPSTECNVSSNGVVRSGYPVVSDRERWLSFQCNKFESECSDNNKDCQNSPMLNNEKMSLNVEPPEIIQNTFNNSKNLSDEKTENKNKETEINIEKFDTEVSKIDREKSTDHLESIISKDNVSENQTSDGEIRIGEENHSKSKEGININISEQDLGDNLTVAKDVPFIGYKKRGRPTKFFDKDGNLQSRRTEMTLADIVAFCDNPKAMEKIKNVQIPCNKFTENQNMNVEFEKQSYAGRLKQKVEKERLKHKKKLMKIQFEEDCKELKKQAKIEKKKKKLELKHEKILNRKKWKIRKEEIKLKNKMLKKKKFKKNKKEKNIKGSPHLLSKTTPTPKSPSKKSSTIDKMLLNESKESPKKLVPFIERLDDTKLNSDRLSLNLSAVTKVVQNCQITSSIVTQPALKDHVYFKTTDNKIKDGSGKEVISDVVQSEHFTSTVDNNLEEIGESQHVGSSKTETTNVWDPEILNNTKNVNLSKSSNTDKSNLNPKKEEIIVKSIDKITKYMSVNIQPETVLKKSNISPKKIKQPKQRPLLSKTINLQISKPNILQKRKISNPSTSSKVLNKMCILSNKNLVKKPIMICSLCNLCLSSNSKSFIEHLQLHSKNPKTFPCKVQNQNCLFSFSTYGDLLAHVKKHSSNEPFSCMLCSTWLKSFQEVIQHQMQYHTSLLDELKNEDAHLYFKLTTLPKKKLKMGSNAKSISLRILQGEVKDISSLNSVGIPVSTTNPSDSSLAKNPIANMQSVIRSLPCTSKSFKRSLVDLANCQSQKPGPSTKQPKTTQFSSTTQVQKPKQSNIVINIQKQFPSILNNQEPSELIINKPYNTISTQTLVPLKQPCLIGNKSLELLQEPKEIFSTNKLPNFQHAFGNKSIIPVIQVETLVPALNSSENTISKLLQNASSVLNPSVSTYTVDLTVDDPFLDIVKSSNTLSTSSSYSFSSFSQENGNKLTYLDLTTTSSALGDQKTLSGICSAVPCINTPSAMPVNASHNLGTAVIDSLDVGSLVTESFNSITPQTTTTSKDCSRLTLQEKPEVQTFARSISKSTSLPHLKYLVPEPLFQLGKTSFSTNTSSVYSSKSPILSSTLFHVNNKKNKKIRNKFHVSNILVAKKPTKIHLLQKITPELANSIIIVDTNILNKPLERKLVMKPSQNFTISRTTEHHPFNALETVQNFKRQGNKSIFESTIASTNTTQGLLIQHPKNQSFQCQQITSQLHTDGKPLSYNKPIAQVKPNNCAELTSSVELKGKPTKQVLAKKVVSKPKLTKETLNLTLKKNLPSVSKLAPFKIKKTNLILKQKYVKKVLRNLMLPTGESLAEKVWRAELSKEKRLQHCIKMFKQDLITLNEPNIFALYYEVKRYSESILPWELERGFLCPLYKNCVCDLVSVECLYYHIIQEHSISEIFDWLKPIWTKNDVEPKDPPKKKTKQLNTTYATNVSHDTSTAQPISSHNQLFSLNHKFFEYTQKDIKMSYGESTPINNDVCNDNNGNKNAEVIFSIGLNLKDQSKPCDSEQVKESSGKVFKFKQISEYKMKATTAKMKKCKFSKCGKLVSVVKMKTHMQKHAEKLHYQNGKCWPLFSSHVVLKRCNIDNHTLPPVEFVNKPVSSSKSDVISPKLSSGLEARELHYSMPSSSKRLLVVLDKLTNY